ATVIGVDINEEALRVARKTLGNQYVSRPCDVTKSQHIVDLFEYVDGTFGKLDILVNNAAGVRLMDFQDIEEEDFSFHFDLLLKGPILLVKYFSSLLYKTANPSIVNIGSVASLILAPKHLLYSLAKGALERFTHQLARDLPGIRSNCILPAAIETPILKAYGEENVQTMIKTLSEKLPCRRFGKPEDIANCILFLSSEKASFISGTSIVVDGGLSRTAEFGI
ncbi:MAG: SDR family oxidoreductase, partial [Deltaproteobacteria bacterium]|nr:SDR family oxidoreductase [Deltaproteobacteria bacterium]